MIDERGYDEDITAQKTILKRQLAKNDPHPGCISVLKRLIFPFSNSNKTVVLISQGLEALPRVLIKELSIYLDPLSLINLSHACKIFKKCLSEEFFVNYNSRHNYKPFKEEHSRFVIFNFTRLAPPVKVTLAHYYFDLGIKEKRQSLIEKSAALGLPKAQKLLKKQHQTFFRNSYYVSPYYPHFQNRDVMYPP